MRGAPGVFQMWVKIVRPIKIANYFKMKIIIKYVLDIGYMLESNQELLSGADIQKSRSSAIVMMAEKYGILDKNWLGISY